jgi:prepilin-type N-terminal cleavage/methylation domain-containing protein
VRNVRTHHATAHRPTEAFTLVEVLVVIFILAVLAAIIAGVAGYVMKSAAARETAATQKILMEAIQAFHDAAGDPSDSDSNYHGHVYPQIDPSDPNSGKVLIGYLTGSGGTQTPAVKAATDVLLKLPKDAWDGDSNSAVKDAWRQDMRYDPNGGLGGKPVVISEGPDGKFGGASAGDPNGEDDVRSDESQ